MAVLCYLAVLHKNMWWLSMKLWPTFSMNANKGLRHFKNLCSRWQCYHPDINRYSIYQCHNLYLTHVNKARLMQLRSFVGKCSNCCVEVKSALEKFQNFHMFILLCPEYWVSHIYELFLSQMLLWSSFVYFSPTSTQ